MVPAFPDHRHASARLGPDAAEIQRVRGHPLFGHPYHVEDYQRDLGAGPGRGHGLPRMLRRLLGGRRAVHRGDRVRRGRAEARPAASRRSSRWRRSNGAQASSRCSQKMRDEHPSVRGIRRIMEFDKDVRGADAERRLHRGREPPRKVRLVLRHQPQLHADGHHPRVRAARQPRRADDPRPLRQARHQAGRDRAVPRGHEGPRAVPQHVW